MASLQEMYDQISASAAEIIPALTQIMGKTTGKNPVVPEDVELTESTAPPGQQLATTPPAEVEDENVGATYADRRIQAATSALRNQRNARKQVT
jgi:hypothetical protein